MKNWIQYTITSDDKYNHKTNKFDKCEPYQKEKMGSFGVSSYDGRYSYMTIVNLANKHVRNNIDKITGFKLYSGDWLNESNLIHEFNPNKTN